MKFLAIFVALTVVFVAFVSALPQKQSDLDAPPHNAPVPGAYPPPRPL